MLNYEFRFSILAISNGNEESAFAQWNHLDWHSSCAVRSLISAPTYYGLSWGSQCEDLHSRRQQRHVLRAGGCQVCTGGGFRAHNITWSNIYYENRTHLREIRDRSVLRLFESNEVTAPQALPGGAGVPQPLPSNGGHWDQDQVRG